MGTVHDWSATEAVKAAKDRHAQILRGHHGAPISDGQTLIVLCACGSRCSPTGWEAHLIAMAEKATQRQ